MKVSVVIPVYNRERYIRTAILSLLRQADDADLDIVVVDDGSTDRTVAVVSELAAAASNVRTIRQPRSGVARARNAGLDHIHPDAELVTFLDSDDVSVAGRFAAELPLFQADADLALTYSMLTLTNAIDDPSFASSPGAHTCTLRGISLAAAIFRRQAIDAVGRFDEALKQSEDLDYLLRFFELSLPYRLVDDVSVLYRRHNENTTRAKDEAQQFFRLALLRSAQRRRRAGNNVSIPKFYDFTALLEYHNAALR
jgi:glycosyltransferase involved in cell wall biosynthesis